MRLYKKIAIFLISFCLQACCIFGTQEVQRQIWVASKNTTPLYNVKQQSELCVIQDKKTCVQNNTRLCADILSGQRKIKPINGITGKEITGNELKRIEEDCEFMQKNPEYIETLCPTRTTPSDSCMEKNGYKNDTVIVNQCSPMKTF